MKTGIAIAAILAVATVAIYRLFTERSRKIKQVLEQEFPTAWRAILQREVAFYQRLDEPSKQRFEKDVQRFLATTKITGISTDVEDEDRILIAASAVIPVFGFPDWEYHFLHEVLLYPNAFNFQHETAGDDRSILGMVGNGYMEGVVILSKKALRHGFSNETDKRNTAIHEFVHILDKQDGEIDGIPATLLEQSAALPWLDLIKSKIAEIESNNSDIDGYGATNHQEFFAVASEYFFERPELLQRNHPKLYATMETIFQQQLSGSDASASGNKNR